MKSYEITMKSYEIHVTYGFFGFGHIFLMLLELLNGNAAEGPSSLRPWQCATRWVCVIFHGWDQGVTRCLGKECRYTLGVAPLQ